MVGIVVGFVVGCVVGCGVVVGGGEVGCGEDLSTEIGVVLVKLNVAAQSNEIEQVGVFLNGIVSQFIYRYLLKIK